MRRRTQKRHNNKTGASGARGESPVRPKPRREGGSGALINQFSV